MTPRAWPPGRGCGLGVVTEGTRCVPGRVRDPSQPGAVSGQPPAPKTGGATGVSCRKKRCLINGVFLFGTRVCSERCTQNIVNNNKTQYKQANLTTI